MPVPVCFFTTIGLLFDYTRFYQVQMEQLFINGLKSGKKNIPPYHTIQALPNWRKNNRNCLPSALISRQNVTFLLNLKSCEKYAGATS